MNEIMYKATSQGGIITTAELPNQSDYQKIVRLRNVENLFGFAMESMLFLTLFSIR